MNLAPHVMLLPEETREGTVYHPANTMACDIAALIGKAVFQDHHLPKIEALGFRVIFPNGQPLPFPKAYRRAGSEEPRHIRGAV